MRRAIKTEAIVLKKRSLPNQDKIITLFTKEAGKVSAFAKGIKKITSRRLPHAQTANLINTVLYRKNEHFYLQETSIISGFTEIKKDQEKLQYLYQFFFVMERLLPDHQAEPDAYNLTLRFLVELSRSQSESDEIMTKYLNQTLQILGYLKEDKNYADLKRVIEEIIHEKLPELHITLHS